MKLTIAQRLWAPTTFLATMLLLAGGFTLVRTQGLIEDAAQAQGLQQQKLELALRWRGHAAAGEPVAEAANKLRPLLKAESERAALQKVSEREAAAADPAARAALVAALEDLVQLQSRQSDAMRSEAAAARMRTVWGVLALMAAIVGVSALGAWYLVRTVRQPLREATELAQRIGAGDLTTRIDRSRDDEIGELMRSLVSMRDALRHVIGEVQQSADQIGLASAEVASGNIDLSQRTEHAASNLQQTAASVEQLTATARHSGDAAAQASQLAASAAQVAQRGGQVVTEVVSTMGQISDSSRRIADIIGTIDGIAFQTNILALNAAVEAARAGEQGRGFAVVAGEVRTLAQRSAQAAREIKTLIGSSVERVEAGTRLVGDAGSTMDEIVASVQRVADIIGEIAAGAHEQGQGIAQVNGAVTQLDQMTQQNAALVEQSAAAAESLREQAARLAQTVAQFRTAAQHG